MKNHLIFSIGWEINAIQNEVQGRAGRNSFNDMNRD
jgi:hypothetical protein